MKPEILAPAGDADSLKAALAAGADAVYFGLDDGFNARARAVNFSRANLRATVEQIHRAGAKAYVTFNTLVFEPELPVVVTLLRAIAEAGVDAIIVQDPVVCLLARAIAPTLELHASTQMTISSPSGAKFAESLGVTRFVAPREFGLDEVRAMKEGTALEMEVFVHGALCVSWSGQCLTSEAWGGRSANRGQCAQSCRLPYELIVDGEARDLGDVQYLLSPKDQAAVRAVPELSAIGVTSLKIEGRQKGPHYVATAVGGYRRWVDAIESGDASPDALARDVAKMALAYTRGFGDGFFAGSDHQTLVEGRFPKHRGVLLGRVTKIDRDRVSVGPDHRPWTGALATEMRPEGPNGARRVQLPVLAGVDEARVSPKPGMGIVFDQGRPEDKAEPGGPIFHVDDRGGGNWMLTFGRPGPDLARVRAGDRVWITQDPSIQKETDALLRSEVSGRIALYIAASGKEGEPLSLQASLLSGSLVSVHSTTILSVARSGGITHALLEDKLGGLGGTPFTLAGVDTAALGSGLHLPVSELKELRRRIVSELEGQLTKSHAVNAIDPLPTLRASYAAGQAMRTAAIIVPLCRTEEQLEAAIAAGSKEIELDWMEMVGLTRAVERAKSAGVSVHLATLRVEKPGEEVLTDRLAKLRPDGILIRHWGGMERLRDSGVPLYGDFSLNVTNSLTANYLLNRGLAGITASFDLDEAQLFTLLDHVPAEKVAVVVHHRIPTFHTEHCVYAHLLSSGRDYKSCGRPCDKHAIELRDHKGHVHPVIVDAGCRNTVFNEKPQSAARLIPQLLAKGVRRFRIDFVRETRDEVTTILASYNRLLAGNGSVDEILKTLNVPAKFGVTGTPMQVTSQ